LRMALDYGLTEEQREIKELARKIAEKEIIPIRAELDEKGEFPWDIVKSLAQADLFRVFIPEEYNGLGMGILELCLTIEELARGCAGISLAFAGSALGATPIWLFGTEEQKKKYLTKIANGEWLAAFAVTEPSAGSDTSNLTTTARLDGDYYILNGRKQWITNGGEAKVYSVIAATNRERGARGQSAFIVEDGFEGLKTRWASEHLPPENLYLRIVRFRERTFWVRRGWVLRLHSPRLIIRDRALRRRRLGLRRVRWRRR